MPFELLNVNQKLEKEAESIPTMGYLFLVALTSPLSFSSLAFDIAHSALLSRKSLSSANEKHIAESDIIAGHDSSASLSLQ